MGDGPVDGVRGAQSVSGGKKSLPFLMPKRPGEEVESGQERGGAPSEGVDPKGAGRSPPVHLSRDGKSRAQVELSFRCPTTYEGGAPGSESAPF